MWSNVILGLSLSWVASALATQVQVLGLFPNQAMLQINQQTKLLKQGQEFQGVKLVTANSNQCMVMVDGKAETLQLGSQVNLKVNAPQNSLRIEPDDHGMYRLQGVINNQTVNMLVDTGASTTALNINQARLLGINYDLTKPRRAKTASTDAIGYPAIISQISIGNLKSYDVPVLVIDGDEPDTPLLGMSLLKRFELNNQGNALIIKSRY